MEVTNYLLSGMILQVGTLPKTKISPEKLPSRKENDSLSTTIIQGLC